MYMLVQTVRFLASLMRNYFPKRSSSAQLHTLSNMMSSLTHIAFLHLSKRI